MADGRRILADGTILDADGNVIGKLDPGDADLSPEELAAKVKAAQEAAEAEREADAKKRAAREARRKKKIRALWMLAAKLAKQKADAEAAASGYGSGLSEAERMRLQSEADLKAASDKVADAKRRMRESQELIGHNTLGRTQSLQSIEQIADKEEKAKAKLAKLKELQNASDRPNSATSVSSMDDDVFLPSVAAKFAFPQMSPKSPSVAEEQTEAPKMAAMVSAFGSAFGNAAKALPAVPVPTSPKSIDVPKEEIKFPAVDKPAVSGAEQEEEKEEELSEAQKFSRDHTDPVSMNNM
jgi:hypothetical protein